MKFRNTRNYKYLKQYHLWSIELGGNHYQLSKIGEEFKIFIKIFEKESQNNTVSVFRDLAHVTKKVDK